MWFRSDSAADHVVQEQFEPSDVRGVFESEEDADRFLDWYADRYGVVDTSHLELYSAEIALEGYGRKHDVDDESDGPPDANDLPEQVDFEMFRGDK